MQDLEILENLHNFTIMKEIIYIDMDGVLTNFSKKLQEYIAAGHPRDCYKHIPNFYQDMEPMPGAIEAFKELSEHFDCYILSAPSWNNVSCYTDKRLWVEKYLGKLAEKKLILTHNKGMHSGRALIDDRTKYGVENFKGEHIHFGTEKFPDWKSVVDYLTPASLTDLNEPEWDGIDEAEEKQVMDAIESVEPYFSTSSLHIYEERYRLTFMGVYRLLYAIGDSQPMIERLRD